MRIDAEVRLLQFATRQYSVFSRRQALACGMSSKEIQQRLAKGYWQPVHRGVYVMAGVSIGWEQHLMAACLVCGPHAAASHTSAAAIWDLMQPDEVPHVTIDGDAKRRHARVVVHRSSRLEAGTYKGFRVTTPMRTLLDLADCLDEGMLEQVLDTALRRRRVHLKPLATYLGAPANRTRPGSGALRQMVSLRRPGRPLGSELETKLFRLLRRFGLPVPVPQFEVRTSKGLRYIDFAYPQRMLGVEVDGFEEHGGRRSVFDEDHIRRNDLEALGWRFRGITSTQIDNDPLYVAMTIGGGLGLSPKRWA